jgi:hypothetical protein
MIFIVNCDKMRLFKTFESFENAINYLIELNSSNFDGRPFSLFGRGQKEIWNGEESKLVDDTYYTDSALLTKDNEYFVFYIRCIDSKGNIIELN